jgi:hypothetical protein
MLEAESVTDKDSERGLEMQINYEDHIYVAEQKANLLFPWIEAI